MAAHLPRYHLAQVEKAAGVSCTGRLLALVRKEFLALAEGPKRSRMVLIVPPMIQLLVFGYAATFDLKQVPYAVYNEDRGVASRDLVADLRTAPPAFTRWRPCAREGEIAPLVDARQALLVIHVGPRFTPTCWRAARRRCRSSSTGATPTPPWSCSTTCAAIVNRFNDDWIAARGLRGPPARLETRAWFNPNLESRWFFIPGIIGMLTLVVTMLVTALTVAREREQGTFDQLLVTPLRPGEILLGKMLPGFVIGIVQATLILLVATLWFKVPFLGSLPAFYCSASPCSCCPVSAPACSSQRFPPRSNRACWAPSCSWCRP
jgi:ABC-2 type transport system permease protein